MGVKVRFDAKAAQYFVYVNHNGQRKAYAAGTDERKAKKLGKEMDDELRRGKMKLPATNGAIPTLEAFAVDWLLSLETRCKTTTINKYRHQFRRHINPRLGTQRIDTITTEDCEKLILHWARTGLRTGSLRLILATLRAALTGAKKYLPVNPALELRQSCQQPNEEKHEVHPYTQAETDKLLAASLALGPDVHSIFLISLRAGLRIGEVLALTWRDVDFPNHRLCVQRSRNQDGIVTSPKRGRRYVDLNAEIAAYLQSLPQPTDLTTLVCRNNGLPYEQGQVYYLYRRVARSAGLRYIRLHDLRHTFVSQLLEAGVPLHYVSQQVGHASIEITANLYAHLVPGANREWIDRLKTGSPA